MMREKDAVTRISAFCLLQQTRDCDAVARMLRNTVRHTQRHYVCSWFCVFMCVCVHWGVTCSPDAARRFSPPVLAPLEPGTLHFTQKHSIAFSAFHSIQCNLFSDAIALMTVILIGLIPSPAQYLGHFCSAQPHSFVAYRCSRGDDGLSTTCALRWTLHLCCYRSNWPKRT